jgi:hypothetical protein
MMFLRPRSLASTLSVLTHRPTFAMATATVACQRSGVAGASGSGLRCRGVGGAFSSSARAMCSSSSSSSSSSLATVPQPTKRQLLMLALAGGVPFIGFGFADNFIMIIAGDQIDATLGIRFGLSTLAAAGLGNLISDVIGLSLQDVIESKTSRFFKAPPLTEVQLELPRTRFVKVSANSIGISIGCLLGMVPLLFMHDRKTIYFDDDEMSLYHSQFAPYGVSPQQFFELLHHGKWRTADAGTPMVTKGDILHSVFFLHSGSAQAALAERVERVVDRRHAEPRLGVADVAQQVLGRRVRPRRRDRAVNHLALAGISNPSASEHGSDVFGGVHHGVLENLSPKFRFPRRPDQSPAPKG